MSLSNAILAGCPPIFCAVIAIVARTSHSSFETPCGTQTDNQAVFAYSSYIADAEAIFRSGSKGIDRQRALDLAKRWDQGNSDGTLKPLRKVSWEDSLQEGVRGKVLLDSAALTSFLLSDATDNAKQDLRESTLQVLLAMRLTEYLRYCDLTTIFESDQSERAQMKFLKHWQSQMDDHTKADVRNQLMKLSNSGRVAKILELSRTQYVDWRKRMNIPLTFDEQRLGLTSTDRLQEQSCVNLFENMQKGANETDGLRELIANSKVALQAESKVHRSLASVSQLFSVAE